MPSQTDKTNTRSSIQGAQGDASGITNTGQQLTSVANQWLGPTLSQYQNNAVGNIDPNAVAANRKNFQDATSVTQNMISGIASKPGGYTPGEVSAMKMSATAPIAASARTAQGQMADRVARTGNAASYGSAAGSVAQQRGQDLSTAQGGVDAKAAEARRQDTQSNQSLALNGQMGLNGQYQSQMNNESNLNQQLQFAPQEFMQMLGLGTGTQLGANGQNIDLAKILAGISTQPGGWSTVLKGIMGGGAKIGDNAIAL